jgi:hypothetical protein
LLTRTIDAWVDIDAAADRIWEVLVDFPEWGIWNSFIPLVEGKLQIGETLKIQVNSPGLKPMTFKPKVFSLIKNKEIIWGGSFLWIVYRGEHLFLLEPLSDNRTRFRQIERFHGPMVLFMGSMIKKTEMGYHQMNNLLKKRVEELARL